MVQTTINDAVTMGGEEALLAGRYRVVKPLGQGGMGSVYLAEDTQLDNLKVAIKMLPAILVSNKRAIRQLKAEALVSLKLSHPNIATMRAFEENNGNPFIVMDYVEGQTLDDLLADKGSLTEEETLRILTPVAAALDYAHGEGVVHRDIKPGNVMIRHDGRPFVLDFGIAREIQETMTRVTGKLSSGTLMYMSPEQNNGDEPTPAQDVYSFAAMAYECLKGEPPFVRGNIEDQIKNKLPPPLPGGTRSCASAVMAGLAKRPEDRPETCAAVLGVEGVAQRREAAEAPSKGAGESAVPSTSRTGVSSVPCPECGRNNLITDTFKCKVCGRDYLCMAHYDKEEQCCADCAEKARLAALPKAGDVKTLVLPGGAKMEMVYCAPGDVLVVGGASEGGRCDDQVQRRVAKGFWIGKYEVTQAQWESVMGYNPSDFKGDARPVESVSWKDCKSFIDKVNALLGNGAVRLPTEVEWEFACRAGGTGEYCRLADGTEITEETLGEVAWYGDTNILGGTHPVGKKKPNAFGLYDMYGNVWEWCEDRYWPDSSNRVIQGGSWCNNVWHGKVDSRDCSSPGYRSNRLGFRLAASQEVKR